MKITDLALDAEGENHTVIGTDVPSSDRLGRPVRVSRVEHRLTDAHYYAGPPRTTPLFATLYGNIVLKSGELGFGREVYVPLAEVPEGDRQVVAERLRRQARALERLAYVWEGSMPERTYVKELERDRRAREAERLDD